MATPRPPNPRLNPRGGDRRGQRPLSPRHASPLWYALAFVMLLGLAQMYFLAPAGRTMPYSEFKALLRTGAVAEVTVGDQVIRGTLKQAPSGDGQSRQFTTTRVDDPKLTEELEAQQVKYTGELVNRWLPELLSWIIPLVFFIAIWGFFFRRMGGAEGGVMSFARSRGKVYADDEVKVRFSDVAGVDEAEEELKEIVEFLKNPKKYTNLGGRIPKGVLLVGPPGTGKTLLARAVAGEADVPFFFLSGSEFVEMFVGVGASRVRDLFEQAKEKAPCIVFIDELDAIGKTRAGNTGFLSGHDEREQTLNQLLAEMDGFDSSKGVIIMAATNRPEVLDAALLRAGRFDRQVVVDRPDVKGREAILLVHARNVKLAPSVDLHVLAARTPGMAGADLANIINEAALLAARKGKDAVDMADLEEAVDRVVGGLERKSRVLSEKERDIVAHHEIGHALVASSLPQADPVHKVTIIPRGVAALGATYQLPLEDRYLLTRSELEDRIAVLLGGRVAEEVIYGEVSTGAHNDLERATELARLMVMQYGMSEQLGPMTFGGGQQAMFLRGSGLPHEREYSEESARRIDGETRAIIDRIYDRVRDLLTTRKRVLVEGAAELKQKETLEGDRLRELLAGEPVGAQR